LLADKASLCRVSKDATTSLKNEKRNISNMLNMISDFDSSFVSFADN